MGWGEGDVGRWDKLGAYEGLSEGEVVGVEEDGATVGCCVGRQLGCVVGI